MGVIGQNVWCKRNAFWFYFNNPFGQLQVLLSGVFLFFIHFLIKTSKRIIKGIVTVPISAGIFIKFRSPSIFTISKKTHMANGSIKRVAITFRAPLSMSFFSLIRSLEIPFVFKSPEVTHWRTSFRRAVFRGLLSVTKVVNSGCLK